MTNPITQQLQKNEERLGRLPYMFDKNGIHPDSYKQLQSFLHTAQTNLLEAVIAWAEERKMLNTKEEADNEWFYGLGFNHSIDRLQTLLKEALE